MKKHYQTGFGGLQMILGIAAVILVTAVALPKYNAFVSQAKLGEAVSLGGESKKQMAMYYMTNERFPRNAQEAEQALVQTISPPEFVRDIVINTDQWPTSVTIEIHMKDGAIENETAEPDQYIYYTAKASSVRNSMLEWTCGSRGLNKELLAADCRD